MKRGTSNRKNNVCGQVERTPRIDSFELARTQGRGGILCGSKLLDTYHDGEHCEVLPPWSRWSIEIELSRKANGCGGEQLFFVCPACGRRARHLYSVGTAFRCRKCARLNYKSQQRTKSGAGYYYGKGMEILERRLMSPVYWVNGFDFCEYTPDRPRYMHRTTYMRHLERLSRYQWAYILKYQERQLKALRRLGRLLGVQMV